MCNVSEEMPKYRSHKIVHALKIKTFVQNESNGDPKDHSEVTIASVYAEFHEHFWLQGFNEPLGKASVPLPRGILQRRYT